MNAIEYQEETATVLASTSALGAIAVAVEGGEVTHIVFGHGSEAQALAALARQRRANPPRRAMSGSTAGDEQLAEDVVARLIRYAEGEPVDFSDVPVSLDHLSAFQRRVVKACRAIRCGARRTYGELAAVAGSPGAARAVGQVMAGNRTPLVVPCHRVVASGGGLGGFSAPQGLAMKRKLLALEQAVVDDKPLVN
jgi:methylated-DNA-[protein]-cysteine S-methyltransferase